MRGLVKMAGPLFCYIPIQEETRSCSFTIKMQSFAQTSKKNSTKNSGKLKKNLYFCTETKNTI